VVAPGAFEPADGAWAWARAGIAASDRPIRPKSAKALRADGVALL
jgi:hypothetical protein